MLATKAEKKLSFEEVAIRFGVAQASVFRWTKQLQPCKTRNKPALKINMKALENDVKMYPDAFQYERAERLGVGRSYIGYALKRLKISHKKNISASEI